MLLQQILDATIAMLHCKKLEPRFSVHTMFFKLSSLDDLYRSTRVIKTCSFLGRDELPAPPTTMFQEQFQKPYAI
jgi:hypothetical protein